MTKMYERYLHLKALCSHSTRLAVVIQMGWKAPQYQEMFDMFWGEPVHSIILPTNIFPQNEDGYPVLTKKTQKFVM